MKANNSRNGLDEALEIAVRAYKASAWCSRLFKEEGHLYLSEQWRMEAIKVAEYLVTKFPENDMARVCRENGVSGLEV